MAQSFDDEKKQGIWTERAYLSGKGFMKPVFDGNNRIIICSDYDRGFKGIECYDCEIIEQYPKNAKPRYAACAFDNKNNVIYIYGGEYITFLKYNLSTKIYEICVNENGWFKNGYLSKYNVIKTGSSPSSILVNNIWHIVGGRYNNYHIIMNINDPKPYFRQIYQFKDFKYNYGSRIIYSHSSNQFILMGGYCDGEYIDSIYTLNNFDPSNTKWVKIKKTLPKKMYGFGAIIVKQFIVVFGGYVNYRDSYNHIYYCDIESFKWNESYIKCPNKGKCYSILNKVMDKDDDRTWSIIFGFIRMGLNKKNIPKVIVKLILNFIESRYVVHLFNFEKPSHHIINVKDIIAQV